MKNKIHFIFYSIFYLALLFLLGITILSFFFLYLEFFHIENNFVKSFIVSIVIVLFSLVILFRIGNNKLIYKIFFSVIVLLTILIFLLYILKISGLLNKFSSIENFRQFISSFGYWTVFIFIIFQFLQVVVLPIPGIISVGAGVLLFGPLLSALYSFIGIIMGSLLAFYIGRRFGDKGVSILIGKNNLEKGLKLIEGKDKFIFTFMFLFPFFPDDLLCFLAGITKINKKFFVIMIVLTRFVSIFASAFSLNNNLLPYNTWWGILIWFIIFAILILFSVFIINHKRVDNY